MIKEKRVKNQKECRSSIMEKKGRGYKNPSLFSLAEGDRTGQLSVCNNYTYMMRIF